MKLSTPTIIGVTLLTASAGVLWLAISRFIAIDSALDSGASFNYKIGTSDHLASHPFSSTFLDSPWPLCVSAFLALSGVFVLIKYRRSS